MDFQLSTTYKPQGDQPRAHRRALLRPQCRREGPGPARRHRLRQDLYDGENHRRVEPARAHPRAQQKPSPPSSTTSSRPSSPRTPSNTSSSYYDYYQPEAYIPSGDLFIEKEATINEELDKLRLSATRTLFERRDAIIVSSVSCIYGLGSPEAYYGMLLLLEKGQQIKREDITRRLVEILYERNDVDFRRGTFRVRGDIIEVFPTYDENAYRIELFGDEIDGLSQIDPLFGTVRQKYSRLPIYPKSHYVVQPERKKTASDSILAEMEWWEKELESQGRLVESQRIHQRTRFDLEMIKSVGYCHGIENYSRHFSGRLPGEPPPTPARLLPPRLPPLYRRVPRHRPPAPRHVARRPLPQGRTSSTMASGCPAPWTTARSNSTSSKAAPDRSSTSPPPPAPTSSPSRPVSSSNRSSAPPASSTRPSKSARSRARSDDLLAEIRDRVSKDQRVLVTTLTKRMSEDLANYYTEVGVRCRYMHSEIETLERHQAPPRPPQGRV